MQMNKYYALTLCSGLLGTVLAPVAQADFIQDSKADLHLRNFYMNRDFRDNDKPGSILRSDGKAQHKAEDWGQAFMLRYRSGYTEGTVGFGLDALGLVGIKLDSGAGTGGTGALVRSRHSGSSHDNSSFTPTLKAKLSKTVVSYGGHEPILPIVIRNDTRLLPQTFIGTQIVSNEIDNLTLTAGQYQRSRWRNSSDREKMPMFADGSKGGVASNRFNFAGAQYKALAGLQLQYFYAQLKDNYKQQVASFDYTTKLSEDWGFKLDGRYFKSDKQGNTNIDNKLYSSMLGLSYKGHWLSAGMQKQKGDTGMPFIGGGTDPWTMNTLTYHHFLRAKENSWQVRYDYDFANLGINGLTLMARYVKGHDFKIAGERAREWERDIDIVYNFQSDKLKNLSLMLRNVAYRGTHSAGVDENRVIVNYKIPLL
ncbi:OprD family porin [Pseudomonas sp. F1_0610]|uniref:OprD family porin n=1 Tax=Pseudomonas sp. F1_0610 TaxID=3114284 RepID=UPI0039C2F754